MELEDQHTALIKRLAQELATASHQAKDKEVSGLFMKIDARMEKMEQSVSDLASRQKERLSKQEDFEEWARATIGDINKRSVTWDLTSKGFLGMIVLSVTALFGSMINFFIKQ